MTDDEIIDGILAREQEGTPPYWDGKDPGGRTSWGISERWHPELWQPGPPTKAQARVCYFAEYVAPFDALEFDDRLRVAAIDDGVLMGVEGATKRLQWVVGVAMDGWIGPKTIAAIKGRARDELLKAYVTERAVRAARQVQHDPMRKLGDLVGWLVRILRFLP